MHPFRKPYGSPPCGQARPIDSPRLFSVLKACLPKGTVRHMRPLCDKGVGFRPEAAPQSAAEIPVRTPVRTTGTKAAAFPMRTRIRPPERGSPATPASGNRPGTGKAVKKTDGKEQAASTGTPGRTQTMPAKTTGKQTTTDCKQQPDPIPQQRSRQKKRGEDTAAGANRSPRAAPKKRLLRSPHTETRLRPKRPTAADEPQPSSFPYSGAVIFCPLRPFPHCTAH